MQIAYGFIKNVKNPHLDIHHGEPYTSKGGSGTIL